jgi:MerR family transcriptional regulator, light-induced transcriptional regulator
VPVTTEQPPARHPIGVVAERTGLSQDLLRVWERRYRAVEPSRTLDGQRVYSDSDVERLRLLRLATKAGRSIRQVAPLTTEELASLVRDDEAARHQLTRVADGGIIEAAREDVTRALELARGVNAPHFESFLRRSAAALGIPVFLDALAEPFLRRMAEERERERLTRAQERVATATIQRVLEGAIQFLGSPPDAPNLLLATPVGEQNMMGSVLAAAAAAAAGWRVTNLGIDLAAGEIAAAALAVDARVVCVSIVSAADRDRLAAELRALRSRLPVSVPLVAGGAGALALEAELNSAGIHVVRDLSALRTALQAEL